MSARAGSDAVHRIDLLTAVMHELGHLLGYDHADSGLMQPTLSPGVRWLPEGDETPDLVNQEAATQGCAAARSSRRSTLGLFRLVPAGLTH